jgi:hypothetical protein
MNFEPGESPNRPEWQSRSACAGSNSEKFYPSSKEEAEIFLPQVNEQYCSRCTTLFECRAYSRRERFGIWAGVLRGISHKDRISQ